MSREFNANLGPLVFNLEWRLTLFTLVLLPFLVNLGFWQLQRAEEKRDLAARHARQAALPPASLEALVEQLGAIDAEERRREFIADRAVHFDGQLIRGDYVLLDNRLRDGRFGYELIALARAESGRIAVNLGWIPGDPARLTVPQPELPEEAITFTGRIYLPSGDAYLLAEQLTPSQLPAVVQDYPVEQFAAALSEQLQQRVLPLLVRIDPQHPYAHRADWVLMNQSPEKHTGYAVQWFTMAVVLLIAFLWRSSNIGALVRGRKETPNP